MPSELESPSEFGRVAGDDSGSGVQYCRRPIPLGPGAPGLARETLTQLDTLTNTTRYHAQLLVSELLSQQGRVSGTAARGEVVLELLLTPAQLRVEMTETDHRETQSSPPLAGRARLASELQLLAQLADRWGVRRDAVSMLWFELDVDR
jgi:hypothetical protein